jgi:hypothetical protein
VFRSNEKATILGLAAEGAGSSGLRSSSAGEPYLGRFPAVLILMN